MGNEVVVELAMSVVETIQIQTYGMNRSKRTYLQTFEPFNLKL